MRVFLLNENKVFLKFHYGPGKVTAATREFVKPVRADRGRRFNFDPDLISCYEVKSESGHRRLLSAPTRAQSAPAESRVGNSGRRFTCLWGGLAYPLRRRRSGLQAPGPGPCP